MKTRIITAAIAIPLLLIILLVAPEIVAALVFGALMAVGNLKGIAKLLPGMKAEDAIARMEGTTCGRKPTSCPDQIAQALKGALAEMG